MIELYLAYAYQRDAVRAVEPKPKPKPRVRRIGALTVERGLHSVYLRHERFHVAFERFEPHGRRLEVRWQPEMYPLEAEVLFMRRRVIMWSWLPTFRRVPIWQSPKWTGRTHEIRMSWLFDNWGI